MNTLTTANSYRSPIRKIGIFSKLLPSLAFFVRMMHIVIRSSSLAKKNQYDTGDWVDSSIDTVRALEAVGINFQIENLQTFKTISTPCVFVANHMSTLETFVLPCIIQPFRAVTFVVKKQLLDTPLFKHVMRSRNPVVVGRTNPRDDLAMMLEDGIKNLQQGVSLIIFPQRTRSSSFDSKQFNSIGVKLAKRANVPVIPIAIRSDAWNTGHIVREFGKIEPQKRVRFYFGEPIYITGNGKAEHEAIVQFISNKLREWGSIL
jgi:1-acyl-sn-glycerol-3-phosphate acyltransferase